MRAFVGSMMRKSRAMVWREISPRAPDKTNRNQASRAAAAAEIMGVEGRSHELFHAASLSSACRHRGGLLAVALVTLLAEAASSATSTRATRSGSTTSSTSSRGSPRSRTGRRCPMRPLPRICRRGGDGGDRRGASPRRVPAAVTPPPAPRPSASLPRALETPPPSGGTPPSGRTSVITHGFPFEPEGALHADMDLASSSVGAGPRRGPRLGPGSDAEAERYAGTGERAPAVRGHEGRLREGDQHAGGSPQGGGERLGGRHRRPGARPLPTWAI